MTTELDLKKMARDILEQGHLMSLATRDEGGLWVSDVIYVCDDDLNIYWMSSERVRHSKAVLVNPEVAGTITVTNKSGEKNLGIQFSGVAKKLDGLHVDLAVRHLRKRGRIDVRDASTILKEGHSWYVVEPKLVNIINEELWGFKKETLTLV